MTSSPRFRFAAAPVQVQFRAFGTLASFLSYDDEALCTAAFENARAACERYEQLFSRMIPTSDVCRISASAPEFVRIAPETFDVLAASLRYCAEGAGLFDITIGAVSRLWDFRASAVPDPAAIREALAHVNWRTVELERTPEGECCARVTDPAVVLDVGGTAKGWIADSLAAQLREAGLSSFIVNLGGNVYAAGIRPDGVSWNVGVRDPRHADRCLAAVRVSDASVVTSGVYERCFVKDGRLYHHVLDPKRGYPAETDLLSATIVADASQDAEGYSTTMLALGLEQARAFAETHPVIRKAFLVDVADNVHVLGT